MNVFNWLNNYKCYVPFWLLYWVLTKIFALISAKMHINEDKNKIENYAQK